MQILENTCRITMLILAIVHITTAVLGTKPSFLTFLLGVILLVCSIPLMGKSFRVPAIIFLLIGLGIIIVDELPFSVLVSGTGSMLTVVSILTVMSLFTIPIEVGGYFKALEYILIKYFHNETLLFLFVLIATQMFGSFLLLGTLPLMMALFGEILQRYVKNHARFFATAVSRGYTTVLLWAPGSVNILLVLQATGAQWSEIFFPGVFLSLLGILTAYVIESKFTLSSRKFTLLPDDQKEPQSVMSVKEAFKKIGDILLVVVALVFLTIFFERLNIGSSTSRVLLAGLVIAPIWILKYHKSPDLKKAFQNYWGNGLIKTIDMAGLFVAMGIISEAVNQSSYIMHFEQLLPGYINMLGPLVIPAIPLMIILLSLIGIHPFITIVMIGNMLNLVTLPVSRIAVAQALSFGGSISYIVSPFAGVILTLAKFTDRTPAEISLKWNRLFTLIYIFEGIIFIYLVQMFFS